MAKTLPYAQDKKVTAFEVFKRDLNNYGVSESNKFEIKINPPYARLGGSSLQGVAELESIALRAESVNLAGRNISTFDDTNIYGPIRQIPDGITYAEDINITFIMNTDARERTYFERWQELVFDHQNWNLRYYSDYIGSLEIYLLDRQFKRGYGIKCEEVYPKTIGAIDLSHGNANTIGKVTVNFAFRYWNPIYPGFAEFRAAPRADDQPQPVPVQPKNNTVKRRTINTMRVVNGVQTNSTQKMISRDGGATWQPE